MKPFKSTVVAIDGELIYKILEAARRQSSDIVIIPRFINSEYNGFETAGLQSRTLVVLSSFSYLRNLYSVPLWDDPSLSYIALLSKDIPPFLKIMKDNNIYDMYFIMHTYIVNGIEVSVARYLKAYKQILMKNPYDAEGEMILQTPILELIPYQDSLDRVRLIQSKFESSTIVNEIELNMKDDIEFVELWNGLSSDGSKIWVPDANKYGKELKPYVLYLAKCMFSFSKADSVVLQIRDNIIGERSDVFLVQFTVTRKKGKEYSIHKYYASGIKL